MPQFIRFLENPETGGCHRLVRHPLLCNGGDGLKPRSNAATSSIRNIDTKGTVTSTLFRICDIYAVLRKSALWGALPIATTLPQHQSSCRPARKAIGSLLVSSQSIQKRFHCGGRKVWSGTLALVSSLSRTVGRLLAGPLGN